MAKEIELKLKIKELSQDATATLNALFNGLNWKLKQLRNVYYDTPDFELNGAKIALRIRTKGDQFIQTLKTKGVAIDGLHQRGEWEWPLPHHRLDETLISSCEAWPETFSTRNLKPVFETNFSRHQVVVDWQKSKIEIALDQGEVISGDSKETINEIELELISGDPNDLKSLGERIKEHLSVELYDVSKAERGYNLHKKARD